VNGVSVDTVLFEGASTTTWYTTTVPVNLQHGIDSIQIGLFWGWMSLDYLGVPTHVLTSVEPQPGNIPLAFALHQNYPNPFNPSTTIDYQIPKQGNVSLKVYDIVGRLVRTLVNEVQGAGAYKVRFDASTLASGVYFYRLQAGSNVSAMKMILVK